MQTPPRLPGPAPLVLVTGASSGVGLATAHRLARRGQRLALLARGVGPLQRAAEECRGLGAAWVGTVPVDVRDDAAVGRSLEDLTASRGPLDAVVSSAGVVAYGRLDELEASLFDGVVATNLLGSANVLRHALPGMRAQIYRQAAYAGGPAGRPPPVVWSADKAARVVVRTLDHPRPVVHGGGLDAVTRLGFSLLPRVYDAWVGPLFARLASDPLTRLSAQADNVAQSAPEGNRLGGGHGSGLRAAVATTTSLFRSRR